MLYEAVIMASHIFHEDGPLGSFYDDFFKDCPISFLEHPEALGLQEVRRIIEFLNQWRTRYRASPEQLHAALHSVLPELSPLRTEDLLHVDLDRPLHGPETVSRAILRAFDTVAGCGQAKETTAASKVLHLLHPHLLVMWDNRIAPGYAAVRSDNSGILYKTGEDYTYGFLPRVQLVARRAVAECQNALRCSEERAVEGLCLCRHTLAKVIDEYNYAKYTLKRDEVWITEMESETAPSDLP